MLEDLGVVRSPCDALLRLPEPEARGRERRAVQTSDSCHLKSIP